VNSQSPEIAGVDLVVIVVNYGNAGVTRACYDSVMKADSVGLCVRFIVVDNLRSRDDQAELRRRFQGSRAAIIELDQNIGYFPALNVGIAYCRDVYQNSKAFVIGNNDLEFSSEFFRDLASFLRTVSDEITVISPKIVTPAGVSQNPHSIHGISRGREFVYDLYYSNFFAARIVQFAANLVGRIAKRRDVEENSESRLIKLGFGACYILTDNFFKNFHALWSPSLLMGEELLFSWQLSTRGCRTFYCASLQVVHRDNTTISTTPRRWVWQMARSTHATYRMFINPWRVKMQIEPDSVWVDRCNGSEDLRLARVRLQSARISVPDEGSCR
jgi:GT2 family glycosyltransferase